MGSLWQSDTPQTALPVSDPEPLLSSKKPRRKRTWSRLIWPLLVLLLIALGIVAYRELTTARLQAREFSRYAASLSYRVEPGPSPAIRLSPPTAPSTSAWAMPICRCCWSACSSGSS